MSFLNRLLGKTEQPKQRVQVCVECGMPVADHKQWCSILQGQNELKLKAARRSRRKPASIRAWRQLGLRKSRLAYHGSMRTYPEF